MCIRRPVFWSENDNPIISYWKTHEECYCAQCSVGRFYKRFIKGVSRFYRDSRGRFRRVSSRILGVKMVKPFDFGDRRSLLRAIQGKKDKVVVKCNYKSLHVEELQKPGEYTVDTLWLLNQYFAYYYQVTSLYNSRIIRNSHKFSEQEQRAIRTQSDEYINEDPRYTVYLNHFSKKIRLKWTSGNSKLHFAKRVCKTTGLNSFRTAANNCEVSWSSYHKGFVYIEQCRLLPEYGWVNRRDVETNFYQCRSPQRGCVNYTHNSTMREWRDPDTGSAYMVCTRCSALLPRGSNVIQSWNADPIRVVACEDPYKCAVGEKILPNTLLLGTELEVVVNQAGMKQFGDLNGVARAFNKLLNKDLKMACIKHDGSINDHGNTNEQGFEIVSLPGTLAWHLKAWDQFFAEQAKFVGGWNHLTCGMHVHISRAAVNTEETAKLICFINDNDNYKFIEDLAGRGKNRYARIIHKKYEETYNALYLGTRMPNMHEDSNYKYNAMRLDTGKPTYEFRIFRSNVSKHGFLKNVEACAAAVHWVKVSGKETGWKSFVDFVDKNRNNYQYLTPWMIMKKYIKESKANETKDLVFEA